MDHEDSGAGPDRVVTMRFNLLMHPYGNGWVGRIENIPVYLSGDTEDAIEAQAQQALDLWCEGFPTTEAWLDYLKEHGIPHSREGSPRTKSLNYERLLVGSGR